MVPGSESPGSGSHGKTAGRAPESNNPGPAKGASETDTEVDAGRQQGKDSDNEKSTRPDCRLQRSSHQEGSLITESELDDLTDEERTLKAFMLFSCVIYFVAGLAYAVKPGFVIYVLQDISRFFDHPTSYHDVSDRFWVSMSFSMMMTISFLAFYAHYNIRTNKNYIIPLLIAKASSTVSALVYFIFVKRYQPCLAVVFVDGMLFWITLHLYIQANKGFLDTHTTYCRKELEGIEECGKALVAVFKDTDKKKLLDDVLIATRFYDLLEARYREFCQEDPRPKNQFSVVTKPNFMFAHSRRDPTTFTDPELVEHLVERVREKGFTNIAIVESQTTYENYYANRTVRTVAKHLGYTGENYRIVDLTEEMVPYNYGGRLGWHYVGPTWKDANFRISFAKNKTHTFSGYTLTLKNNYGTLPIQNKLKAYHTEREYDWPTIETLKQDNFPVDFGLIDATVSADGQFGVITDPEPNVTQRIIGGDNLVAVDWVGAKKMGLDPEDVSIGRFHYLAVKALGSRQ